MIFRPRHSHRQLALLCALSVWLTATVAAAATAVDHADQPATERHGVQATLAGAARAGKITELQRLQWSALYSQAKDAAPQLHDGARLQLQAVIGTLSAIAARGELTASRMPALFLTLQRNYEWCRSGKTVANGQRVEFDGSELVWEKYPSGLQLQMLANFGKANALWYAKQNGRLRSLLNELIGVAAQRGGGFAWEYYFPYGGGQPPWVSAISQGTAIQALTRAAVRLQNPTYLRIANRALPIFLLPPPVGVRVPTKTGAYYVMYSFAPRQRILNGFIQALNGLFDFAFLTHSPVARALFLAGDAQAMREVPRFDTGSWSLYEPGVRSSPNYHRLLRDFLKNLCQRTARPIYCTTAQRFTSYIRRQRPPERVATTLGR